MSDDLDYLIYTRASELTAKAYADGMPVAGDGTLGARFAAELLGIDIATLLWMPDGPPYHRVAGNKRYKILDLAAWEMQDRDPP